MPLNKPGLPGSRHQTLIIAKKLRTLPKALSVDLDPRKVDNNYRDSFP
ncbi:MAG TPA: hypothetical protein VN704_03895 [Verrucomicrobiae bacterium]|nr:hypothetical protein [Verrucomicrobiae bacterium]